MSNTFYNLTNDHLIKGVLKDEDNLKLLLNDLFDIKGNDISIKNTEILNENKNGKYGIIDILFELDSIYYILEIQNLKRYDFEERLLYYTSSIIKQYGLNKNENYKNLVSVRTLSIINYEDEKYDGENKVNLLIDNNKIFTDRSIYKIVNLKKTKIKSPIIEMFKCDNLESLEKYKVGKYKNIYETIKKYNMEEKERKKMEEIAREMAADVYTSEVAYECGVEYGKNIGESKGFNKGINQRNIEIINSMLKDNMNIDDISRIIKLPKSKVKQYINMK